MVTADSVKAKIQGLINSSNETTGENDTDLTSAVNRLKEGYGQGGGGDVDAVVDVLSPAVQQNGARTDYRDLFKNSSVDDAVLTALLNAWNSIIKNAGNMFYNAKNITDGAYHEKLDFSQCQNLSSVFSKSAVTKLKKIDARATTSGWNGMANMFINCADLTQIDEFYPSASTSKAPFQATFGGCVNLEKLIFKSEISQNGLDLSACTKLSKESIVSIFYNLSATTSGLTITLSEAAIDRISAEEGSYVWWYNLAGNDDGSGIRPNWNILLA